MKTILKIEGDEHCYCSPFRLEDLFHILQAKLSDKDLNEFLTGSLAGSLEIRVNINETEWFVYHKNMTMQELEYRIRQATINSTTRTLFTH